MAVPLPDPDGSRVYNPVMGPETTPLFNVICSAVNALVRHIRPAGRKLGMGWVNWQVLRRSHATWLKLAGADVKDAQAQMRQRE